jgi:DNA topoisomerase-1
MSAKNQTILVLVESPAKCAKIESYLGPGYRCIATYGHFRELDGLKSIDVKNNFKLTFVSMTEKMKQIHRIRTTMAECPGGVIIATDDDREGEAIGWHICDTFKLPVATTPRIVFHEITKPAIAAAISKPGTLNMNLVYAQFARQILDLLVGYNISPTLWSHIASNTANSLSAGRCQSPALRLVYDNQKEIDAAPGKMVYNTTGYFTKLNIAFTLTRQYDTSRIVEEFLEDSVNHDHIYNVLPPKKTTKQPPSPFSTSLLQQKASSEMHYSPAETMAICQKLYESSFITYMRTDSKMYSEEFIGKAKAFIGEKWSDKYINPSIERLCLGAGSSSESGIKDTKKLSRSSSKSVAADTVKAQEAHEAIRPTKIEIDKIPDTFTQRERNLYKMIWTNTVESCMAASTGISVTATVTAPKNDEYRYTTELVEFPGWRIVGGFEKDNPHYQYLQNIKKNTIIPYNKIKAIATMIDLKSHYTEAGLIKILEEKGIGRPSTFSSLIEKIQKRGYVAKDDMKGRKLKCVDFELSADELQEIQTERDFGVEKNKLMIQPLGTIVIEFLSTHFNELFEYNFTKTMEDDLDKVAKGEKIYTSVCEYCLELVSQLTTNLKEKNIQKDSVKIDENHTYIVGSKGPVIKYIGKDEDGKKVTEFKSVKKDVDLAKLKRGEYSLDDIVDERGNIEMGGIKLGVYNDNGIVLKKGKYGLYFTWGEHKKSLSGLFPKSKNPNSITYNDIVRIIESSIETSIVEGGGIVGDRHENVKDDTRTESNSNPLGIKGLVRKLNDDISIRNGKYGDYIFYKTSTMKDPKFLKLKGFSGDYKTGSLNDIMEWIKTTYNI